MNSRDLTLKQMFDITAKLVGEQEDQQFGQKSMGKEFMETTVTDWWWNSYQSSAHKSVCLLGFCVVPRKDPSTSRIQRSLEEKDWRGYDREKLQRLWRYQWRAEWNIFPGFTTLQLCGKVNDLLSDLGEAPETFTGRILVVSMFNDISCDRKGNKEECLANARVCLLYTSPSPRD